MAKLERVTALVSLLQRTREPRSLSALCEELQVSRATANRLLALLRDQHGFDIQYDREANGYVLKRSPQDPTLARLLGVGSPELAGVLAAHAILEQIPPGPLGSGTTRAREQLGRLRSQWFGDPQISDRIQLRMAHPRMTREEDFNVLVSALATRRRLRFDYRSRSQDAHGGRQVSPQRLTFYRSNWYLAAWCHAQEALRVFSVDRVSHAAVLKEPARELSAALLARELDSSYGIFPGAGDHTAVLKFNALAARWAAEEEWHPDARRALQPDGSALLKVPYHNDTELVMEVLRHGANCEVLSPPALRAAVAKAAAAAAAQYA
jgi:predicted DNA-binding transcriptional regulator YafY